MLAVNTPSVAHMATLATTPQFHWCWGHVELFYNGVTTELSLCNYINTEVTMWNISIKIYQLDMFCLTKSTISFWTKFTILLLGSLPQMTLWPFSSLAALSAVQWCCVPHITGCRQDPESSAEPDLTVLSHYFSDEGVSMFEELRVMDVMTHTA